MARELLWREYPTDQRGTYFSSFWTGAPELVADMHEPAWRGGALGNHVDQRLDGRSYSSCAATSIRRYPGVVAHAAREARQEDGIPLFEANAPIATLFHVFLPPNVLLVGFAMTDIASRRPAKRGGSRFRRTRPSRASASTRRATSRVHATA